MLIETVHGLRAMHELNVMHRDIKSANIFLLNPAGNEKVNDQEKQPWFQAKLGDMNVSKVTGNKGLNYT